MTASLSESEGGEELNSKEFQALVFSFFARVRK